MSARMVGTLCSTTAGAIFALTVMTHALAGNPGVTPEQHDVMVATAIARVLPGVVGILVEIDAETSVACDKNDVYVVKSNVQRETATGFIIHPDGWIATNGHVVTAVREGDEKHITQFLQNAVTTACGPRLQALPEQKRKARIAAILSNPENRTAVKLTKRLEVYLAWTFPVGTRPNGYTAVVKAYSRPIDPSQIPKDGSLPNPPMWDVAILKVEATDLPAVGLAPSIDNVFLGQELVIVGYPGVVLWHDFLSEKSRAEATVTFGHVSSLKLDVNDREILQTDAPISWGNSGGPAFNLRGEVIGVATFLSTSLDGEQAIQGFNFLIPVDSIHALARQIGLIPRSQSAFTENWNLALDLLLRGQYRQALPYLDAADKIVPNLIDLERVRRKIQHYLRANP